MKKIILGILITIPLLLLGYTLSILGGVKDESYFSPSFIPDSAYVQKEDSLASNRRTSNVLGILDEEDKSRGKKSTLFYNIYLLFIIYFVFVLYMAKKYIVVQGFSSEKLSSDLAIETLGKDRYGSAVLAQSLVSLLSSPFTKTPLSMAIDASWGQGKSSLINMTQNELEEVGIQSIVFNAWHHQHDKHILSSLMKSMLNKFIPSIVSWENVVFKAILFYNKVLKTPNGMMWLLFYMALIYIANSLEINGYEEYAEPSSLGLFLLFILKTLQPYGNMTHTLTKKYTHIFSFKTFDKMVGLEPEFIEEINHLVRPLGRVVIFVDDLDRCADENIFNVMQTINYLTAIPNIFIVMSVDKQKIIDALERYYGGDRIVAEEYLNKIFNVTLKIPEIESDFYEAYKIDENEKKCKNIKENLFLKQLSKLWIRWFGMLALSVILTTSNIPIESLDRLSLSLSNILNTASTSVEKKEEKLSHFDVNKQLKKKMQIVMSKEQTKPVVYVLNRNALIPNSIKENIEWFHYIQMNFTNIIEVLLSNNINLQLALMGVLLLIVLFVFIQRYYKYREDDIHEVWLLVHRIKGLNPREKNILFNKINLFMVLGTKKYVSNIMVGTMFQMLRKLILAMFHWIIFFFVVKVEHKKLCKRTHTRMKLARNYTFNFWIKKQTYNKDDLKILKDVLLHNKAQTDSRFDVVSFDIKP